MKLKDIVQGKVYTDKDRPPFQVKEDLSKQGFAELKGQARYLAGSVKDLVKGIQQKNDDVIETELDYIIAKSKLMKDMLSDKRYNESVNEGKFKTTLLPQKKDINRLKIRFQNDPRRLYTLKDISVGHKVKGDPSGTSYLFVAPGNRKERFTKETWHLANEKGWLSLESINEAAFSSPEAQQILNQDITKMSKILGKASQQIIKIMMDGVKGGRYDAMDIVRGIETGPLNRTHEGERSFMKMLWRKVRSGFRRYSKGGKLRR